MSKVHSYRGLQITKFAPSLKWEIIGKHIDSGWDTYYYRFSTLKAAMACIDRYIESGEWAEGK